MHIPQRLQAFLTKAPPTRDPEGTGNSKTVLHGRDRLSLWSFSVLVGILSHIGFDLISHDTNLLFYPWYENVRLYPEWWYTIWFETRRLSALAEHIRRSLHILLYVDLLVPSCSSILNRNMKTK